MKYLGLLAGLALLALVLASVTLTTGCVSQTQKFENCGINFPTPNAQTAGDNQQALTYTMPRMYKSAIVFGAQLTSKPVDVSTLNPATDVGASANVSDNAVSQEGSAEVGGTGKKEVSTDTGGANTAPSPSDSSATPSDDIGDTTGDGASSTSTDETSETNGD